MFVLCFIFSYLVNIKLIKQNISTLVFHFIGNIQHQCFCPPYPLHFSRFLAYFLSPSFSSTFSKCILLYVRTCQKYYKEVAQQIASDVRFHRLGSLFLLTVTVSKVTIRNFVASMDLSWVLVTFRLFFILILPLLFHQFIYLSFFLYKTVHISLYFP